MAIIDTQKSAEKTAEKTAIAAEKAAKRTVLTAEKAAEKAAQAVKNKITASKRKDAATKKLKAAEAAIIRAADAEEKAAKAEEKAHLAKLKEDAENAAQKRRVGRPRAQKNDSYDNVYGNENSFDGVYGDKNSYLPVKADTKILDNEGSGPDNADNPSFRRLESLIESIQFSLESKLLRLQSELDAVQEKTDGKGVHNLHMVRIMCVCFMHGSLFCYSTKCKDDRRVRTKRSLAGPGHHRSSDDFVGNTDTDLKFLERQERQANRDRYFEFEQRMNREKYRLQLEDSSSRRFTGMNCCSEFENKHDEYYEQVVKDHSADSDAHSDKRCKMCY